MSASGLLTAEEARYAADGGIPKPCVAGSNPAGGATYSLVKVQMTNDLLDCIRLL